MTKFLYKRKVSLILIIIIISLGLVTYFVVKNTNKETEDKEPNYDPYEPYYKLKVKNFSGELANGNFIVTRIIDDNITYASRLIYIMYQKYDRTEISIEEAIEKKYISLEEILSYMTPVSEKKILYKYDGNGDLCESKFSIHVCPNIIGFDVYEAEEGCWEN